MVCASRGHWIIALRNEKGSYNLCYDGQNFFDIIALRNEKGATTLTARIFFISIIALRNEKGATTAFSRPVLSVLL